MTNERITDPNVPDPTVRRTFATYFADPTVRRIYNERATDILAQAKDYDNPDYEAKIKAGKRIDDLAIEVLGEPPHSVGNWCLGKVNGKEFDRADIGKPMAEGECNIVCGYGRGIFATTSDPTPFDVFVVFCQSLDRFGEDIDAIYMEVLEVEDQPSGKTIKVFTGS